MWLTKSKSATQDRANEKLIRYVELSTKNSVQYKALGPEARSYTTDGQFRQAMPREHINVRLPDIPEVDAFR